MVELIWDGRYDDNGKRTRNAARKSLGLKAGHKYDSPGEHVIMVKAIDILGSDTTKTLKVAVK